MPWGEGWAPTAEESATREVARLREELAAVTRRAIGAEARAARYAIALRRIDGPHEFASGLEMRAVARRALEGSKS